MEITLQIDELKALLKSAGPGVKTTSLDQLLTWGQLVTFPQNTAEEILLSTFGISGNAAFYTAIADELRPSSSDYWMRADPVSLQAGMSRVFLVASGSPEFPEQQRAALQDSLNLHFAEDGLQFLLPNNNRWYIHLDSGHPQAQTELLPPPRKLLGEDISIDTAVMGKFWQRCFTEIQMLLFAQPHRQDREIRGQSPISGLWLWGGGLPGSGPEPERELNCSGNSALLQGLALSAESAWQAEANISTASKQLIHWAGDQPGTAVEQLKQLEDQVFSPLLEAVSNGAELTFIAADAGRWTVRKRLKWPWKKQAGARVIVLESAIHE
ncbi:MAG: hypothetical protein IMF09_07125 [Proteobacteria bacterium]|nr:hypothetical protein [Pseudomonadota bacterium]